MMNFRPLEQRSASSTVQSSASGVSIVAAEKAFSFISKGWREVRSSADADLQLIKNRANKFKHLADRELENFINSASNSPFTVPTITVSATVSPAPAPYAEIDFVNKLQPKISEIRRAYSSPDFKFYPPSQIKIDMSAIRDAIMAEVNEEGEEKARFRNWSGVRFKARKKEEGIFGEYWDPIKALKSRFKELESKSSSEILEAIKKSEFMEKFKTSWKAICKDTYNSKEVLPMDVPELLACLVRQSSPLLDQIGINKDISDKIVESLCSKRKNQLLIPPLQVGESSILGNENTNDELDLRVASVLQSTGHCYEGGLWSNIEKNDPDKKRHVAIVTTASLPWMTGTAVNPLFRAAYLAKSAKQNVTLLVPWLCRSDQELVYPNNLTFNSPEEQESYIHDWLEKRVGFKADFKISFYPGKFSKKRRSIIPAGDTSQFISSKDADIAILEEPEHLNWYHHGKRWTDKFNHVVGIIHTNYLEYIKRERNGALQAFFVKHINDWVVRAYCHKVLRLSAATQDLPKSVICNVHGVNPKFLKIGERVASEKESGEQTFPKGAYFLGKMVWAKGYKELIDLLARNKKVLDGFNLDVYGNGEDAHEVQSTAKKLNLNLNFMKGRDHADDSLHGYKIFINPSISDVLCTATAEALAMGKFVVCADHPSNEFFRSFPNCLTYKTPEDFVSKVKEAIANEPQPLTLEQRYNLSWEAATQRFMEYSDLDKVLNSKCYTSIGTSRNNSLKKSASMPDFSELVDGSLAFAHYCLTGNEFLRLCTGAIPGTRDYGRQHCQDLHLLPPQEVNPIYGW